MHRVLIAISYNTSNHCVQMMRNRPTEGIVTATTAAQHPKCTASLVLVDDSFLYTIGAQIDCSVDKTAALIGLSLFLSLSLGIACMR